MLLSGLSVILIANRKTKIEGTQFLWTIMGLVFVLTSCEYLEYWCVKTIMLSALIIAIVRNMDRHIIGVLTAVKIFL